MKISSSDKQHITVCGCLYIVWKSTSMKDIGLMNKRESHGKLTKIAGNICRRKSSRETEMKKCLLITKNRFTSFPSFHFFLTSKWIKNHFVTQTIKSSKDLSKWLSLFYDFVSFQYYFCMVIKILFKYCDLRISNHFVIYYIDFQGKLNLNE